MTPGVVHVSTMKEISHGNCRILSAPERGAIVTSLKINDREFLFLDRASFEDPDRNVRGGVPVLFPLCGPTSGATYVVNGQDYSMKQHGFARTMPWNVLKHDADRLDLELTDSKETLAQYPFEFRYHLAYQAEARGLLIEQTIENRSTHGMPVQFGFHPYFLVEGKTALDFDLPVTRYEDNKSPQGGDFQGFDFSRDEIDWAFPNPTRSEASFRNEGGGVEVRVSFDATYRTLVFWTLKGSPFVCLEPWSSPRLAFPNGSGMHHVAPGEKLESWVRLTVDQF